jgi:2-iminoacetate synthase ThiH
MPEINIQVPPNLNPNIFGKYLDAGINDWGGISPVTIDYVNPEFILKGNGFIKDRLKDYITLISDETGLVREDYIN